MPTGYTAPVANGTLTQFDEFALSCARAFGALIDMREQPLDAPIPAKFEPSQFYQDRARAAIQRLRRLEHMSPIDAQRAMQQEYALAMSRWRCRTEGNAVVRARYLAMIDQASSWMPPTIEHLPLKEFMLQQLRDSLAQCNGDYYTMPTLGRWPGWLRDQILFAADDAVRYRNYFREECERANDRSAWVRELRWSLAVIF